MPGSLRYFLPDFAVLIMNMNKQFIVTNFAYGTGPYLRTTELALAFNDELERRGKDRLGILVPHVYGDKQRKIMLEEFGNYFKKYPGEIVLDADLGKILKKAFFHGDISYNDYLKEFVKNIEKISAAANRYLKKKYTGSIAIELARSPRISYDIAPAYFTSFTYIGELMERSKSLKEIDIDVKLLEDAGKAADKIESMYKIHALAYPGTFDFLKNRKKRYKTEVLTPPIMNVPKTHAGKIDPGVFVTVTGIPGLERLYVEAKALNMNYYSNNPEVVVASIAALPRIISNKNISLQFARSGWGSVWLSMISGTPLVVPDFDSKDDPEIYFNNLAVEKLGIGTIYRGQKLEEILNESVKIKENSKKICGAILERWGTLDGNQYCAKLFVEDFLQNKKHVS